MRPSGEPNGREVDSTRTPSIPGGVPGAGEFHHVLVPVLRGGGAARGGHAARGLLLDAVQSRAGAGDAQLGDEPHHLRVEERRVPPRLRAHPPVPVAQRRAHRRLAFSPRPRARPTNLVILFFNKTHKIRVRTFLQLSKFLLILRSKSDKSYAKAEENGKVSSVRTPMLMRGRLERTETNLMHFKWEVT